MSQMKAPTYVLLPAVAEFNIIEVIAKSTSSKLMQTVAT